jgi:hypothetical protein
MSRRFVLLNAALVVVGLVSAAYVVNELRTAAPAPARRPSPPPPPVAATPPPAAEPASSFATVATRNLFSPTRSEAPVAAAPGAPQLPKPNLYGIILRDGAPVAYLEDPASKRVGGYRVGDAVAGGTLKRIGADHVVLTRAEGDISVQLRDPSKPRPVAQPPAGPTLPRAAGVPGVPPTGAGPQVPQSPTLTRPPLPSTPVLPRRPLPPNLLRRLPPSATDAPAQR